MVDWLTRKVNELTAAAPKSRAERKLAAEHGRWFNTAQLNVPYYGASARFEWQGYDYDPRLSLYQGAIFTSRGRDRLYTENGASSLALWNEWEGITTTAPPMPAPPRRIRIEGRLQDWDSPEKWLVKEQ